MSERSTFPIDSLSLVNNLQISIIFLNVIGRSAFRTGKNATEKREILFSQSTRTKIDKMWKTFENRASLNIC